MTVKAKGGGEVGEADTSTTPTPSLFHRRISRLEQVSIQLRHLHRDYTQCLIAEKQHKANVYLGSEARSHGEREGQASAQSISLTTETLQLKGEITALEEERDFLKYCIEWVTED